MLNKIPKNGLGNVGLIINTIANMLTNKYMNVQKEMNTKLRAINKYKVLRNKVS